jgi:hypothetical protein
MLRLSIMVDHLSTNYREGPNLNSRSLQNTHTAGCNNYSHIGNTTHQQDEENDNSNTTYVDLICCNDNEDKEVLK